MFSGFCFCFDLSRNLGNGMFLCMYIGEHVNNFFILFGHINYDLFNMCPNTHNTYKLMNLVDFYSFIDEIDINV